MGRGERRGSRHDRDAAAQTNYAPGAALPHTTLISEAPTASPISWDSAPAGGKGRSPRAYKRAKDPRLPISTGKSPGFRLPCPGPRCPPGGCRREVEGSGAPFHVTQGLSPNSLGQTNAMSFCLERPVWCGHGNAPASDGARMVHFILLLRKAKPVGCQQPTCLVERLNRRVFLSSRECLEPSPLRRFGGHVRSHTSSSGPSLLGRCLGIVPASCTSMFSFWPP